jgi:hypothetical protein
MELGRLKKKANTPIVVFVFTCIFIIVGLLYVLEKSQEKAYELTYGYDLSENSL